MKAAVLFCHTDEQEPNAAVERELGKQYTQLLYDVGPPNCLRYCEAFLLRPEVFLP